MEAIPIKPERKAQLADDAQRHGQERADYRETVQGIRQGYADLKAGRTQPAEEAFEELRLKHGLPG